MTVGDLELITGPGAGGLALGLGLGELDTLELELDAGSLQESLPVTSWHFGGQGHRRQSLRQLEPSKHWHSAIPCLSQSPGGMSPTMLLFSRSRSL